MDFTAILGILIVFVIISVLYFIYTSNTYIVRINKNQVMEFRSAMELTGLPIITFYQGKEMYNFLLDTGSNISYVNSKSSIQVEKTGNKDVFMGSDGTDRDCEDGVLKLYRGDAEYDCNVAVADLDTAFTELKKCYGVTIHGILGCDFFSKYKYCLDFKELVVYNRAK